MDPAHDHPPEAPYAPFVGVRREARVWLSRPSWGARAVAAMALVALLGLSVIVLFFGLLVGSAVVLGLGAVIGVRTLLAKLRGTSTAQEDTLRRNVRVVVRRSEEV